MNRRWTLYPLTSLPLVGPVELVLSLVAFYRSPRIRYPGILQGESYIGIRALADLSVRLRIANKLSGAVAGER